MVSPRQKGGSQILQKFKKEVQKMTLEQYALNELYDWMKPENIVRNEINGECLSHVQHWTWGLRKVLYTKRENGIYDLKCVQENKPYDKNPTTFDTITLWTDSFDSKINESYTKEMDGFHLGGGIVCACGKMEGVRRINIFIQLMWHVYGMTREDYKAKYPEGVNSTIHALIGQVNPVQTVPVYLTKEEVGDAEKFVEVLGGNWIDSIKYYSFRITITDRSDHWFYAQGRRNLLNQIQMLGYPQG